MATKRPKNRLWNEDLIIVDGFNFYTGANKDKATV